MTTNKPNPEPSHPVNTQSRGLSEPLWILVGLVAGALGAGLVALGGPAVTGAVGSPVEVFAVITGALSVWALGSNKVSGWWIGIASVIAFVWVFAGARLYGEVGIQIFYAVTSLLAIRVWLKNRAVGGGDEAERPVRSVPRRVVWWTAGAVAVGVALGTWLLAEMGGAAPFFDALTTVGSLAAHIWLVGRWTQSWMIWITLDVIYVPLYLSRGLSLTAGLYVIFFVLAVRGLLRFREEERVGLEGAGREDLGGEDLGGDDLGREEMAQEGLGGGVLL